MDVPLRVKREYINTPSCGSPDIRTDKVNGETKSNKKEVNGNPSEYILDVSSDDKKDKNVWCGSLQDCICQLSI